MAWELINPGSFTIIHLNRRNKLKQKYQTRMTKKYLFGFFATMLLIFIGPKSNSSGAVPAKNASQNLFADISTGFMAGMPSEEVFTIAHQGFSALKALPGAMKKEILTVIDLSLPSTEKRLWIIDIANKKILFNDFVAHGRNTGDNAAASFSNVSGSYMSSIGFYITAETYHGKHGLSLRLEGMDKDFNCNARDRAIVMHGADYVSADFIQQYGRLGRSLGCPSVSMDIHEKVIETIKEGSALFIYFPDPLFLQKSSVLNPVI
jgi:hypothetical protein